MTTRIVHAVLPVAILALGAWTGSAGAAEFNVAQGQRLARSDCTGCHSVERSGASPLAIAPPFRDLASQFPASRLREAFENSFEAAHPTMPRLALDADQVSDLLAFFDSLR